MTIPVFSAAGQNKGTMELPQTLFGAPINRTLMHQAIVMQQSNRRQPVAHVKTRGEVDGSTKKAYQQKHTGRARRGPLRSPLLRGGGKTFGPRNVRNFLKDMPRGMRHAALRSCLSYQAKADAILALDTYPDTVKTKDLAALLGKLPLEMGRRILIVTADSHRGLMLSGRNIAGVKVITAAYLNPEDVLKSKKVIFLTDAVKKAEEMFGGKKERKAPEASKETAPKEPKAAKKAAPKKTAKKPSAA